MGVALITGANGFFGRYLIDAFRNKSFETLGLVNCSLNTNLAESIPQLSKSYSKVVHAAGKAHVVPKSEKEKDGFYKVNLQGTINLTKAFDQMQYWPASFVFISTVGVYGVDEGELLDEKTTLEGSLPYQKSKIMAERHLQQWTAVHNIELTILRLPLLVGKNPPGNLGAMIRAIKNGYYFRIGRGDARRSMVLAEDVANLIASDHLKPGIFHLTDGEHPSYKEMEQVIARRFDRKIKSIPQVLIKLVASFGDYMPFIPINNYKLQKLQSTLTFSDEKARELMYWNPKPVLENLEV